MGGRRLGASTAARGSPRKTIAVVGSRGGGRRRSFGSFTGSARGVRYCAGWGDCRCGCRIGFEDPGIGDSSRGPCLRAPLSTSTPTVSNYMGSAGAFPSPSAHPFRPSATICFAWRRRPGGSIRAEPRASDGAGRSGPNPERVVGRWGLTRRRSLGSDTSLVVGVRHVVGRWGLTRRWSLRSDTSLVVGVRHVVGRWGLTRRWSLGSDTSSVVPLIACLFLAFTSSPASACIGCGHPVVKTMPEDGDVGVPTSAMPLVIYPWAPRERLGPILQEIATGNIVAATVEWAETGASDTYAFVRPCLLFALLCLERRR